MLYHTIYSHVLPYSLVEKLIWLHYKDFHKEKLPSVWTYVRMYIYISIYICEYFVGIWERDTISFVSFIYMDIPKP